MKYGFIIRDTEDGLKCDVEGGAADAKSPDPALTSPEFWTPAQRLYKAISTSISNYTEGGKD